MDDTQVLAVLTHKQISNNNHALYAGSGSLDVYTQQPRKMNNWHGVSRQTFFADQNSSGQHNSLQYGDYQRPQPVSLRAPSRGTFSAALLTSRAPQPSGPVQQSRRLIDRAEASTIPSMCDDGDIMPFGTDLGAPLQTHISLDSLLSVPTPNSSQQESFRHKHGWAEAQQFPAARRPLPLVDWDTHVAFGSRKRGLADVARQQNEAGAAGQPARQPMQTHTRTVHALQQPQAESHDEADVNDDSAHPDHSTTESAIPSQMEDLLAAAGVQSGTVQIHTGRNMVPRSSVVTAGKHVQAKAGTRAAGKARAVGSPGRAVAVQPQQGQVEGQSGRAAARALRQSGSFASPTRSSAAKAAGKDNPRGSNAVKPPAATYQLQRKLTGQAVRPERHAVTTAVATAAPLMTTFR